MPYFFIIAIALATYAANGNALSCSDAPLSSLPYCNTSLPVDMRVADLLSRMSPDEKVSILDAGVPAIPRLGVPSMSSGEALHGACTGCLSPDKCPTSFPAPIALGAAFDQQVMIVLSFNTTALDPFAALAGRRPGHRHRITRAVQRGIGARVAVRPKHQLDTRSSMGPSARSPGRRCNSCCSICCRFR